MIRNKDILSINNFYTITKELYNQIDEKEILEPVLKSKNHPVFLGYESGIRFNFMHEIFEVQSEKIPASTDSASSWCICF